MNRDELKIERTAEGKEDIYNTIDSLEYCIRRGHDSIDKLKGAINNK
jgi:hypothetical protein